MSEPYKPRSYQRKGIKFMVERAAAGLFLDPGLGKTSISLAAIKVLLGKQMIDRVLIIAPLRVCTDVWPLEVAKWADFNNLRVVVLHGAKKEALLKQDADIYLVNPEGLEWLCAENRLKKLDISMLIVDESTKFKHTNTRRFKLLRPHLSSIRRRYILTGTPAPNGLLDLFGQVYILDRGNSLSPYITHFRNNFFVASGFGGYTWTPKPATETRMQEILKPLVLRMAAEDYLELPELVEKTILVDLPPKARKIYDELEQQFLATLGNGEQVTAVTAAAASMKCRQVANGGLYRMFDAGQAPKVNSARWVNLHAAKADAVADLVEELSGQPALIAYDFEHDRDRLLAALGKETPFIGGGVSAKRGSEIISAWNRGEIPALLGHPAAMGHGLNLQGGGNNIIWHSLTWDLEHYEQYIRRVLRQGNEHPHVFVHHIVAKDTIDDVIMQVIKAKAKSQGALLTALRDYAKERK